MRTTYARPSSEHSTSTALASAPRRGISHCRVLAERALILPIYRNSALSQCVLSDCAHLMVVHWSAPEDCPFRINQERFSKNTRGDHWDNGFYFEVLSEAREESGKPLSEVFLEHRDSMNPFLEPIIPSGYTIENGLTAFAPQLLIYFSYLLWKYDQAMEGTLVSEYFNEFKRRRVWLHFFSLGTTNCVLGENGSC